MVVVIISGYPAVGKTTVARAVAAALGLRFMGGGEALMAVAVKQGYRPSGEDWWDTGEGMAFLQERANDTQFDKEVDAELLKQVEKGDIVITSYTLPWLTTSGVKFWMSATQENRAKRMAGRDSLSQEQALRIVKQRDSENERLYRSLYGFSFGDLTPFDFVINTDKLTRQHVIDMVIYIAKKFT